MKEKQFNFVIGKIWEGTENQLAVYAYGSVVHYGNREYAEELRDYINEKEGNNEFFEIYIIPTK